MLTIKNTRKPTPWVELYLECEECGRSYVGMYQCDLKAGTYFRDDDRYLEGCDWMEVTSGDDYGQIIYHSIRGPSDVNDDLRGMIIERLYEDWWAPLTI